jgi:hypothetical protein
MADAPKVYDWRWFRDAMHECTAIGEREAAELLPLVSELDALIGAVVARPTSPFSDRPQDYVVSLLCARAFRLTVSAIKLALAGYPDSAVNLSRTTWEIAVRCLDLLENPVAGALGYLLEGLTSEAGQLTTELDHRQRVGEPVFQGPENLKSIQEQVRKLEAHARKLGHDPDKIRKRHGHLNVFQVCERFGLEKAYRVDYAFGSGHVHEKNVAPSLFTAEKDGGREFEMGPIPGHGEPVTLDSMMDLTLVVGATAGVLGDKELSARVDAVLHRLSAVRARVEVPPSERKPE